MLYCSILFFLNHLIYTPQINSVKTVKGIQISIKNTRNLLSICPESSIMGVLKKVWSDVREDVGDSRCNEVNNSLTPRKVPGRSSNVMKVITCIEAESLAVCLAMMYMLSVTASILIEVFWPLSAKSLLISVLYD